MCILTEKKTLLTKIFCGPSPAPRKKIWTRSWTPPTLAEKSRFRRGGEWVRAYRDGVHHTYSFGCRRAKPIVRAPGNLFPRYCVPYGLLAVPASGSGPGEIFAGKTSNPVPLPLTRRDRSRRSRRPGTPYLPCHCAPRDTVPSPPARATAKTIRGKRRFRPANHARSPSAFSESEETRWKIDVFVLYFFPDRETRINSFSYRVRTTFSFPRNAGEVFFVRFSSVFFYFVARTREYTIFGAPRLTASATPEFSDFFFFFLTIIDVTRGKGRIFPARDKPIPFPFRRKYVGGLGDSLTDWTLYNIIVHVFYVVPFIVVDFVLDSTIFIIFVHTRSPIYSGRVSQQFVIW